MAQATTTGTAVPTEHGVFPPFATETYPSQIFWLTITFAFLFVVLWRVAGPRIAGVIGERKAKVDGDLSTAEKHRSDAAAADAAYQSALGTARAKAQAQAEENRKRIDEEVEKAKAEAENMAREASAKAEAQISAARADAAIHVTKAAQDAAASIVARLIGDKVSSEEAAAAVKAGGT